MTIIFYARVGVQRYVGFRLPGWGVALVVGAFITLASATFFHLGDVAAMLAHKKDEQALRIHRLARMESKVQHVLDSNRASLVAATSKLGELHARVSALDVKGTSLLALAGAEDPSHAEQAGDLAFTLDLTQSGFFAGIQDPSSPVGSNDSR